MKNFLASGLALLLFVGIAFQGWVSAAADAAGGAEPGSDGASHLRKAPSNDGVLDLYFIANRRSQIEPCGCQTRQRGGVQYEASLYNQHPGRPTIRVDAGEWTRMRIDLVPLESLKTRYLLRAMRALEMDAINVSRGDLQFDRAFFDNLSKDYPGVLDPFVSANVFDAKNPDRHVFATERIVERKLADGRTIKVGITGATSLNWTLREQNEKLEVGSYLVKDPAASLTPVIERLRPQVDLLVVMYPSLTRDEIDKLAARLPQIDFLVTNAYFPDPTALILKSGPVYLLHTPNGLGKEVGEVSLKPGGDGRWQTAGPPEALYVSLDLPIDAKIKGLIDEFKLKTRDLPAELPSEYLLREIYAGARSCQSCHMSIYASWEKTPHAHAMDTLVNAGQQYNSECVKCHVTGYRHENGFYSVKHQPSLQMSGVQCELCHGPAQRHVMWQQQIMGGVERWKTPAEYQEILKQAKLTIPPTKVTAQTCIQCHQGENDPHFEFEKSIHKVDHNDVPAAERKTPIKPPAAATGTAAH